MAWVTAGTAKDARIVVTPTVCDGSPLVRWRDGTYNCIVVDEYEGYGYIDARKGTSAWAGSTSEVDDVYLNLTVEMIGTALTMKNGAAQIVNTTDATDQTSGIWEYDNAKCSLVSFTSFDPDPSIPYDVGVSSSAGGTVSTALLEDVDGITGKTFTATPNVGYRIVGVNRTAGISVSPVPAGQDGPVVFTVKALQAGSLTVVFDLIPQIHVDFYLDATPGGTDGRKEAPYDSQGLTVRSVGDVDNGCFRCASKRKNKSPFTVAATADCEVSADGVTYGPTASFAAGSIVDENVPLYLKRVADTGSYDTGLRTTPRLHSIITEQLGAFRDDFAALDTEAWAVSTTSPASASVTGGRLVLAAGAVNRNCYAQRVSGNPWNDSYVYTALGRPTTTGNQTLIMPTGGPFFAYAATGPSGVGIAVQTAAGVRYWTPTGWAASASDITLTNLTTIDRRWVFETNAAAGIRFKVLSADGSTTDILTDWIPWSSLAAITTHTLKLRIGQATDASWFSASTWEWVEAV